VTDIQRNKQTVVEFFELAFNAKQPEEAVEKYLGPQYIQHNPQAPDGAEAFIGFVTWFAGGKREPTMLAGLTALQPQIALLAR
jgi:predicted SnoaL-like aldol condensation-catalyzing enzyme